MKAFAYRVATSEENACKLLGEKALPLAGGTSLLNLMKNYVLQPETVVSITKIPGCDQIEAAPPGLKIGANARIADIASHAEIVKSYPALAQAAQNVASPQIRNMGTIGGNLCQRPSCWYYSQEAFDCLKRGGTTCPAKDGENEFHAILGNDGPCVMVHPSSLAPALIVLGAKVRIASPAGAKEIALEEFFVAPKANPQRGGPDPVARAGGRGGPQGEADLGGDRQGSRGRGGGGREAAVAKRVQGADGARVGEAGDPARGGEQVTEIEHGEDPRPTGDVPQPPLEGDVLRDGDDSLPGARRGGRAALRRHGHDHVLVPVHPDGARTRPPDRRSRGVFPARAPLFRRNRLPRPKLGPAPLFKSL
jgi:CO/xanthine dehydrogenase FAD-binding subunit